MNKRYRLSEIEEAVSEMEELMDSFTHTALLLRTTNGRAN